MLGMATAHGANVAELCKGTTSARGGKTFDVSAAQRASGSVRWGASRSGSGLAGALGCDAGSPSDSAKP
jgi:hypothetical protein